MKNALKTILFLAAGFGLFFCFQGILTPKWSENVNMACSDPLREYYAIDEDTDIQALFLGTSHIELGVDPMDIYARTGIATFNLGSSSQSIEGSYFMLKEAFKTRSPKLVFF